jgi:hypothetical protein
MKSKLLAVCCGVLILRGDWIGTDNCRMYCMFVVAAVDKASSPGAPYEDRSKVVLLVSSS